MNEETCYLCMRITKADILRACFKLFKPKTARKIGEEASQILRETYLKHRIRFCGKKKGRVIGGLLFYLKQKYGFQWPEKGYVTQAMIATVLKTAVPTVREGYYDWLKLLPSQTVKS